MTDIVDPGTINNGDTPDWDVVQTYLDAIYAVINSPGQLDNNNIKAAAAIAYSKLNLANSIATADLANDAVTTAKLANPSTGAVSNGSGVSQGVPNAYIGLVSFSVVTTGIYTFRGTVRSTNGTGPVGGAQVQTIVTMTKNGAAVGAADVCASYESAATNGMVRTQHVTETLSVTAGDTIGLSIQANFGGWSSIDVAVGDADLYWELRSS